MKRERREREEREKKEKLGFRHYLSPTEGSVP